MREETHENYQKVRPVSKFNEETISELCGIILQKPSLYLNFDCYSSRQPMHVRIYPKVNSKNDFDRQNIGLYSENQHMLLRRYG